MAHHWGNAPTSGSTGDAVVAAIGTALTSHPAWEAVTTDTSGAYVRHVWRCLASVSGLPQDFYVVGWSWGTTEFRFWLAEDFDGTSFSGAAGLSGTTDTDGKLTASVPLANFTNSRWSASQTTFPTFAQHLRITAGMEWQLVVHNDHMVVTSDDVYGDPRYLGAFESLLDSADDPMPIGMFAPKGFVGSEVYVSCSSSSGETQFGAGVTTRQPLLPNQAINTYYAYQVTSQQGSVLAMKEATNSQYLETELYTGNTGVEVSPRLLYRTSRALGQWRGKLKSVVYGGYGDFRDSLIIDGDTYYSFGSGSNVGVTYISVKA